MAHLGAAGMGVLFGVLFVTVLRFPSEGWNQRWIIALCTAVLIIAFISLVESRSDVITFNRGIRLENSDATAAIATIREYMRNNPKDIIAHAELGRIYEAQGRYMESAAEYHAILDLIPNDRVAQYNLGYLDLMLNKTNDAVILFSKSVPKLPEDGDRYYYFALSLKLTNALPLAEVMAQQAIWISPKSSRNHALFADILADLGKTKEAQAERELAAQLEAAK